jgi:hypothetical protein
VALSNHFGVLSPLQADKVVDKKLAAPDDKDVRVRVKKVSKLFMTLLLEVVY